MIKTLSELVALFTANPGTCLLLVLLGLFVLHVFFSTMLDLARIIMSDKKESK